MEIQNKLPKARVVYASATGASEPRNMAYMVRLGMWGEGTPFPEFNDFITAVEKRGVGAMEIVAMDMKLRGMYIARQLSFHGVAFKIEEVPLSKDFTKIYDHSVRLVSYPKKNFFFTHETWSCNRFINFDIVGGSDAKVPRSGGIDRCRKSHEKDNVGPVLVIASTFLQISLYSRESEARSGCGS